MNSELFDLTDKVAFVTGAGRGMGQAIAIILAEFGADVIVSSRTDSELERTAQSVRNLGRKAYPVVMDISNIKHVRFGAQKALSQVEKIDILVNNAGTNRPKKSLEVTEEDWDIIHNTNVKGLFFLTQEIAKGMIERRKGKIINMASTLGIVGATERGPYAASKGAVVLMTKALAIEWAPYNINVNAICPTLINTPLVSALLDDKDFMADSLRKIPMARVGETNDVVGAAVFLASQASDFVTGHTLMVDGGYVAK